MIDLDGPDEPHEAECPACNECPCSGTTGSCSIELYAVHRGKTVEELVAEQAERPYAGDFVGTRRADGRWLFICAVDWVLRRVRIGEMGGEDMSDWLNETQASAQFNYRWAQRTPIPWMTMAHAERMNNPGPYQTPEPEDW